jgi:hypothetical protein
MASIDWSAFAVPNGPERGFTRELDLASDERRIALGEFLEFDLDLISASCADPLLDAIQKCGENPISAFLKGRSWNYTVEGIAGRDGMLNALSLNEEKGLIPKIHEQSGAGWHRMSCDLILLESGSA